MTFKEQPEGTDKSWHKVVREDEILEGVTNAIGDILDNGELVNDVIICIMPDRQLFLGFIAHGKKHYHLMNAEQTKGLAFYLARGVIGGQG